VVIVSVVVPGDDDVGVVVAGAKAQVAAAGNPEQEKVTDCVKPPDAATEIWYVVLRPAITVADCGLEEIEKSEGAAVAPVPERVTMWGLPAALSVICN